MILNKVEIHDEVSFADFTVARLSSFPNSLLLSMENLNHQVIVQEIYKKDVEALILFLQQNMPDE